MKKNILLLFGLSFLTLISFSQSNSSISKECRISGGIGLSRATKNTIGLGADLWLQLDYKVQNNLSIATEFEFMQYNQPGYYSFLNIDPNKVTVYDNNFSLLLKY